ncbi:hypothetical protein [Pseudemcibacter aquimaris]|uniref:hypothetical protein n=1 Tax=Pseudemcibacter aquimaris TaxID=2857064 RepID=UPI002010D595|nr:hypothetical protein [Pseudemcibacter aquimaris]MCC3861295.1 hypothetical protein [Pseudemcibacter aquimaris]WDU58069.1 hypothetical protein KW060_12795 [Pseudemcibacter aquimaris]
MIGLNKLKDILTDEDGSDRNQIHEQINNDVEYDPYYEDIKLKSISALEEEVLYNEDEPIKSPVHEKIEFTERRLSELLEENEAKARQALKIIEKLDCEDFCSWTSAVEEDCEE